MDPQSGLNHEKDKGEDEESDGVAFSVMHASLRIQFGRGGGWGNRGNAVGGVAANGSDKTVCATRAGLKASGTWKNEENFTPPEARDALGRLGAFAVHVDRV
jgi:hypothetical protein